MAVKGNCDSIYLNGWMTFDDDATHMSLDRTRATVTNTGDSFPSHCHAGIGTDDLATVAGRVF
ncbi:hypothetical protein RC55_08920 [Herbaspirillum seropedicae]|nr:hypothetical protein ACP92_01400 [Herbaspirillum seropedicae]NQE29374.1 hypothetical protein [Herbaspirillum seropedicae]